MKRLVTTLIAVFAILLIGASTPVLAVTEHCPDGGTKIESQVDGDLDNIVLTAGTSFCVKGSTDATGILVADGETSLFDYLGNGHNVSYYVVYETPSAPPSEEPSSEPTPTPTPEPTPTPTPEPSTDTGIGGDEPTPPSTDAVSPAASSDDVGVQIALLLAVAGILGGLATLRRVRDGS